MSRRYLIAVALLAVLALVFGLVGTVAPPLAEETSSITTQQESSSESVGHFQNPPTYDSGWVDITNKAGQYVALRHGLNTTDVFVDVAGRQSLDPIDGSLEWSRTYGGTEVDYTFSVIRAEDGGYALAGYTNSYAFGGWNCWLAKTDWSGNPQWDFLYGGTGNDWAFSAVQAEDGGYALVGTTNSFGVGGYDGCLAKIDSRGDSQWNKTYGGGNEERAYSLVATNDGGYALAGYTNSYGAGGYDFWLVKTDASGNAQWNKTYGGGNEERAYSLVATNDGGYALAGYTNSYGDGLTDFWLVKTDASGNAQWNKTYGGAGSETANSIVEVGDGGYALTGQTNSYGAGSTDFWLVKTDSGGNAQWNNTYGGTTTEIGCSVIEASDGGYALAGYTNSYGAGSTDSWLVKVEDEMNAIHQRGFGETSLTPGWSQLWSGPAYQYANSLVQTSDGGYALAGGAWTNGFGDYDFWLVKTDSVGTEQWSKIFGKADEDIAFSVIQTSDGGYALAGYTVYVTDRDCLLFKTDSSGNMQWNKTYGGASREETYSLVQTSDGGYALAGYTGSYGAGYYDFWLVKTDSSGNAQWNKTYGGGNEERAYSLVATNDGGYALAGWTDSYGAGGYDFWLVKTDASGNAQWNKTYGGASQEGAYSLVQTSDGGYALAGFTISYGAGGNDFWLVKTDASGNAQWNKTYGSFNDDSARSIVQTSDGGYALAGWTGRSALFSDFWLVKTDASGSTQWSQTYGGAGNDRATSAVQTSDGGYALAGYTDPLDCWLVKTDVESGLALTRLTNYNVHLYRGRTDAYWNYVRVRIWIVKEPSWIYGDINMDGVVDAEDLYILGRNYGKTFSLLSLSGIVGILGIQTVKKRRQSKQPR